MKNIHAGVLDVAYRDLGDADAPAIILLHGFPYDPHAYDEVADLLTAAGCRCIVPFLRGYGATRFLDPATPRSGEQAALGADLLALMDALNLPKAVLAGYDWGGRAACVVSALWPERVMGLVSCEPGYNIQDIANGQQPAAPDAEARLWYQYYFHGARGQAGLTAHREALCRLLWSQWSPTWRFTDAQFQATAEAFHNPDFVEVVIHSYRHRFGLVAGDPRYADIEAGLARQPQIAVPSVILSGNNDGVAPPLPETLALQRFEGPVRRTRIEGVGHNAPQEAPLVFAEAVLDLLSLSDKADR
ncbi:alpha/beta fold hydrolase [Pseudomonas phoenicis]|uniref:alpha/beta fold hydrolase n=1 Tax=unclassified Pseudomonas TaxID=196821 RepID=UPI0039A26A37